ncbi:hypothetical protein [Xanthocytophaga flava]|uniref:hypothetical protein n=1 Tax=Xanthocytophaga flava TaxID=3048013 RepID=UPI0028D0AD67|nr:hypothetical protein [Xanthocytophaga flavus]MDJ1472839.1 hypothetical protein [Xanthocytophaga flavus]
MSDILVNDIATVAYSQKSSVLMTIGKSGSSAPGSTPAATPTSPIIKDSFSSGFPDIEPWGTDNLFPQNVLRDCYKNTIVAPTIDWKTRALYQRGLEYGIEDLDQNGEVTFKRIKDSAVDEFLRRTAIRRYALESIVDFYWYYNIFPEMILSKDRKKIVGLTAQEASYCRWGKQDKKTGLVNTCYINANWDQGGTASSPETTKVPVLDPYYDPVIALKEDSRGYKYIYPVSYPTPGKSFYQLAHWDSLRTSGWLEVAQSIPAFKKAIFKNQVTIKYIIETATWWWEWKYPNFNKMTADERAKIMQKELQTFEEFMSGNENAGNSLMTVFKSDPERRQEYAGWKITPVDNKIKSGIYIEDSQEASSHLLYALSVDPTLIGSAPGKGMGAGSGSDKQAAFNTYLSLVRVHEDLILEPIHFIGQYNGWNPDIRFRFRREILMPQTSGKPKLESTDTNTPNAA